MLNVPVIYMLKSSTLFLYSISNVNLRLLQHKALFYICNIHRRESHLYWVAGNTVVPIWHVIFHSGDVELLYTIYFYC